MNTCEEMRILYVGDVVKHNSVITRIRDIYNIYPCADKKGLDEYALSHLKDAKFEQCAIIEKESDMGNYIFVLEDKSLVTSNEIEVLGEYEWNMRRAICNNISNYIRKYGDDGKVLLSVDYSYIGVGAETEIEGSRLLTLEKHTDGKERLYLYNSQRNTIMDVEVLEYSLLETLERHFYRTISNQ